MYTRCPACLTQFRIRAQQLRAFGGRVRCGACGQAFDAVSRLSDEPMPQAAESRDMGGESIHSHGDEVLDYELPQGLRGEKERQPAKAADADMPGSATVEPDWLEEEKPAPRHTGRWLVVAVLLVLIGIGQVAWFNRGRVYDYFPQFAPWVEQFCQRLGCQVYRLRRPASIELINRDVREHPVYKDALLVNATIANRAVRRQPYPHIQLALYDTDGRALAYREFAPTDYLDASLPVSAGMPPDSPIHVVLELSAVAPGAVSFEFGFL